MATYFFLPIAVAFSLALTPLVRCLAILIGAVDQPGERKIHSVPIPRLGGVAVVLSGILATFLAVGLEHLI